MKDKKTGKTVRTEATRDSDGSPVFRDPKSGRVCLRDGSEREPALSGRARCPATKLSDGQRQAITVHESQIERRSIGNRIH